MTTQHFSPSSPQTITLQSTNAAIASMEFDAALAGIERRAMMEKNHGVLITRHDDRTFTLEISPQVPYGQTLEQWP